MRSVDVVVVGGGMVGLAMAALLGKHGFSVCVLNKGQVSQSLSEVPDPRVSAINLRSRTILQSVCAWQYLQHERVRSYQGMAVWEKDSFAQIDFTAEQTGQTELGYIVENQNIVNALCQSLTAYAAVHLVEDAGFKRLDQNDNTAIVHLDNGELICTQLVIGADGAQSGVRQACQLPLTHWGYDQSAIVATVKTEHVHDNIARQVFTPTGPLAFLPLADPNQCSIVWSQQTQAAEALMNLSDEHFHRSLATTLDMRLGLCELCTKRVSIPLTMRYVRRWLAPRAVVIGDAAHTIHPLAGQGVNLGFQDALELANVLTELPAEKWGNEMNLRGFERARKTESAKMIATMEGFKQLFDGAHPVKKLLRGIGMQAVNHALPVKQKLIAQAMGQA